jgi:hypothetical protein
MCCWRSSLAPPSVGALLSPFPVSNPRPVLQGRSVPRGQWGHRVLQVIEVPSGRLENLVCLAHPANKAQLDRRVRLVQLSSKAQEEVREERYHRAMGMESCIPGPVTEWTLEGASRPTCAS